MKKRFLGVVATIVYLLMPMGVLAGGTKEEDANIERLERIESILTEEVLRGELVDRGLNGELSLQELRDTKESLEREGYDGDYIDNIEVKIEIKEGLLIQENEILQEEGYDYKDTYYMDRKEELESYKDRGVISLEEENLLAKINESKDTYDTEVLISTMVVLGIIIIIMWVIITFPWI